jgi:ribosomal protein S18 acetylase RimI-like enzyme
MHGDDDPAAVHLAARLPDGTVVGACVLLARAYPERPARRGTWQLRGMATAEGLRGRGIGTAMLAAAARQVRARGGSLLWCDAREGAIGFYAAHGFTVEGEQFAHAETGITHLHMWRELPGRLNSST